MCRIKHFSGFVFLLLLPSQLFAQIQFQDVTSTSGPAHQGESWGASWGDINGDGWPDIFASNHRHKNTLWVNGQDGTFTDMSQQLDSSGTWLNKPKADTHGASFVDYDGDGDQDIYVSAGGSDSNQFFTNESGVLVDTTFQNDPAVNRWRARLPAWFDFTNDGLLDFIMASENAVNIYEQTASGFVDRTADAGIACDKSQTIYFANLTGDSRLELICSTSRFPIKVYETSAFPFVDVTSQLPWTSWTLDVAIGDFNGDLKQDFFMVRGQKRLPEAIKVGSNVLESHMIVQGSAQKSVSFVSNGTLTVEVTWSHPYWNGATTGKIFLGSAGINPATEVFSMTYNDPAVAGIKTHTPNTDIGMFFGYDTATGVWKIEFSPGNTRNLAYLKITSDAPVSQISMQGQDSGEVALKPALLLSSTAGYVNTTTAAGMATPLKCISATARDFDNDKDLDLYLVCRGGAQNLANILYENLGDGTFAAVAAAGGAAGPTGSAVIGNKGTGENVIVSDYDVDGFVDLLVTNGLNMIPERQGGPTKLFRNTTGNTNHWIEIDLVGNGLGGSNRAAVGTRVLATSGGTTQLREQNGGYHRWAQDDQRIHFGLGSDTQVDITVEWPDGTVENYSSLPVDCLYRISEGQGVQGVTIGSSTCGSGTALSLSIDDISVSENAGSAVFPVSLSAPADKVISVDYSSGDGTAMAGQDYTAGSGTLVFNVGDVSKFITAPVLQDTLVEGSEQFFISLTNAANANISDGAGTGTILDDDVSACGQPTFDASTEKGVFLWKPCNGGNADWSMRVTGGGDSAKSTYAGSIDLDQAFTSVTNVSIEGSDTVGYAPGDNTKFNFLLNLWNSGFDGLDFSFPAGASACFDTTQLPAGVQIYVGAGKSVMTAPFDMETLSQCGTIGLPPECDKPNFNKNTEKGIFLWKKCDGGNANWFMRVTGGGDSNKSSYQGSVQLNQNFVQVVAVSKESNDTLDYLTDLTRMDYIFNVWNGAYDGVNFTFSADSTACFDAPLLPATAKVYVGRNRMVVTPPLDLVTLGVCQ